MGTVIYTISSGKFPITAELVGSGLSSVVHYYYGEYSFENVPDGVYTLIITGEDGCYDSKEVIVSDYVGEWIEYVCVDITTTTTTTLP